jgi:hypothetical protein
VHLGEGRFQPRIIVIIPDLPPAAIRVIDQVWRVGEDEIDGMRVVNPLF